MGKLRQARAAVTYSVASYITGLALVWPSYTLDLYTSNNDILYRPMTEIESSLVGSILAAGGIVGCIIFSQLCNVYGCKKSAVIGVLPITISWIVISFTKSPVVIVLFRFISGISVGSFLVLTPIFISGVVEDSVRGLLSSAPMTSYSVGVISSYLLGWFLPYKYIIWVNIAVCLTYASLMLTITETPIYLLRINRHEDASRAIAYYRGVSVSSKVVLNELSKLKQQINLAVELIPTDETDVEKEEIQDKKVPAYKLLFISPSTRRAMVVVALLIGLQNLMGANAVQVYAKEVFRHSAPNLSSNLCSVLLAVVILLGNILSAVLADKFGRRFLLMTSCFGSLVCLVVMGIQVQMSFAPEWLSAVLCLVYNCVFTAGAGTIPCIFIAEVFTPEVQSLAAMVQILGMWLISFVLLYVFPFMVKYLGMSGTYYVFAVASVLCLLVSYFFVPETKGLSNAQIQQEFLRNRKK